MYVQVCRVPIAYEVHHAYVNRTVTTIIFRFVPRVLLADLQASELLHICSILLLSIAGFSQAP